MKALSILLTLAPFFLNGAGVDPIDYIKGRVIDAETKKPIPYANILIQKTGIGTSTDSNGNFFLRGIPEEEFIIFVSHIGYKSIEKRIGIKGRDKELYVYLYPVLLRIPDAFLVTASKGTFGEFDSPVPVSIIRKKDIDNTSNQLITNVMKDIPSVSIVGTGYHGSPSIRGLARKRVAVLVDGEKLNSMRNTGPPGTFVDVSNIKRIEVVRGPYSTLYGSDAIGGVVNILTEGYSSSCPGKLNVSYKSVNKGYDVISTISRTFDKLQIYLNAGKRNGKSYKDSRGTPVSNTFFDEQHIITKLHYNIKRNQHLRIKWWLSDGRNIGKPAFDTLTNAMHNIDLHNILGVKYIWREVHPIIPRMVFHISYHYHNLGVDIKKHKVEDNPDEDKLVNNNKNIKDDTYTIEGESHFLLWKNLKILTGVNGYLRENVHIDEDKIIRNYNTGAFIREMKTEPIPYAYQRNYAMFLQSTYLPIKKVIINSGVRFDGVYTGMKDTTNTMFNVYNQAISGNVGLTYNVKTELNITANVGQAFRAPAIKELFLTTQTPGGLNIANRDLKPERSLNMDFGVRYKGNSTAISVSIFRNSILDMIILDWNNSTPMREGTFRNIGRALLYGGEIASKFHISKRWKMEFNLSRIYGYDVKKKEVLRDIPPFKANGNIQYISNRLRISLSGHYSGRKTDVPENDFPCEPFYTFDISSSLRLNHRVIFSASVTNLFNKNHRECYQFEWMRAPGRSFNVGLKVKFNTKQGG